MGRDDPPPPEAPQPYAYNDGYANSGYSGPGATPNHYGQQEPVQGIPFAVADNPQHGYGAYPQNYNQHQYNQHDGYGHHGGGMDDGQYDCLSVVVFVAGCFFCPIWLAGVMFVRRESGIARGFGIASIVCAVLATILVIVIIVAVVAGAGDCDGKDTPEACTSALLCGWCTQHSTCTKSTGCTSSRWFSSMGSLCDDYDDDANSCRSTEGCCWTGTFSECEDRRC
eukprot:NODE_268_length_1769_cov_108.958587_g240_i0.p1 GENE.NODE_268_length_1769_cov_108.958587_g240_i0~~NODE_268_length_1769_cov_108.958587_g240_i0.p1  ORF type:complete len:225 (+),score=23.11 NODE_268_length_1769_cov_108.958587_g240_i0:78-752(+)